MRLLFGTGALLSGWAVATSVFAETKGGTDPLTVQWVKTPSATLDPLSWPERALRLEVDGEAVLKCAYDTTGILSNCAVVSESPARFEFGQASLRMARVFRLRPTLSDGSPLVPGEITFPVKFVAGEFRDPRTRR